MQSSFSGSKRCASQPNDLHRISCVGHRVKEFAIIPRCFTRSSYFTQIKLWRLIPWTKNIGTTVVHGINLRLNFQPTLGLTAYFCTQKTKMELVLESRNFSTKIPASFIFSCELKSSTWYICIRSLPHVKCGRTDSSHEPHENNRNSLKRGGQDIMTIEACIFLLLLITFSKVIKVSFLV